MKNRAPRQEEMKEVGKPFLSHLSVVLFSRSQVEFSSLINTALSNLTCTACGHRMAYRKWRETKVQPGTAGPGNMPGCSLVSFLFRWAMLCPQAVICYQYILDGGKN